MLYAYLSLVARVSLDHISLTVGDMMQSRDHTNYKPSKFLSNTTLYAFTKQKHSYLLIVTPWIAIATCQQIESYFSTIHHVIVSDLQLMRLHLTSYRLQYKPPY